MVKKLITQLCQKNGNAEEETSTGIRVVKKEGKMKVEDEFYTAEHEKLLGDCVTRWSRTSNRDYNSEEGITCHQCRKKTYGPRTQCNNCRLPRGRFCGNCLHKRYGENLWEANRNESWQCPACRDICNCSRCRHLKGWPPTGSVYAQARKSGFKSVAHYLIYTKRAD